MSEMLNNITSIVIMKEFDRMIDKGDRCVKYSDVCIDFNLVVYDYKKVYGKLANNE